MRMRIDENDTGYLTPEYVSSILPTRYSRVFQRAISWPTTSSSFIGSGPDKQAKAVVDGLKPIVYGFREDVMTILSVNFGLEHAGNCLFLSDNRDIADLLSYAEAKFEIHSPIRHFIIGVCCGYPLADVVRFSRQYVRPDESLGRGLEKHDRGDVVS